MGMNPNQIAVTLVILCKTQALLFDGDEPQFRLQLHWWCYCVFGAGGAFEGETRRDVHTARVACFTAVYWRPMVCDSEKY